MKFRQCRILTLFTHACRRSTPEQRRRWEMSNLQFIMSGAEPIKVHTMTTFFTTFAECGLKPSVFCSAYGLAEHVCGEPIPLCRSQTSTYPSSSALL